MRIRARAKSTRLPPSLPRSSHLELVSTRRLPLPSGVKEGLVGDFLVRQVGGLLAPAHLPELVDAGGRLDRVGDEVGLGLRDCVVDDVAAEVRLGAERARKANDCREKRRVRGAGSGTSWKDVGAEYRKGNGRSQDFSARALFMADLERKPPVTQRMERLRCGRISSANSMK